MAEFVGIRVEGGNVLRRTLKQAGADMKDLSAVNRQVANVVLPVAKATAPYGPSANGHIRNTVRAGATQKTATVRAGNGSIVYGHAIHWGWPRKGITANPWLSISAQSTESQWIELYWEELLNVINKVSGD
jgi:hypothetical protein